MGKRRDRREQADTVDLGGDDHAWWANARVTQGFQTARPDDAREREREHVMSGPTHAAPPPQPESPQAWVSTAPDASRAYDALGIDWDASWEEVVLAYRRLARRWHPDRLAEAAPSVQAEGQRRMSEFNLAYDELRKLLQPPPQHGLFTG